MKKLILTTLFASFSFLSANDKKPFYGIHTINNISGMQIVKQYGLVQYQNYSLGRQTRDLNHNDYKNNIGKYCINELYKKAIKLNANAIVGVNFSNSYSFESGWDSVAIHCSGTAVKVK